MVPNKSLFMFLLKDINNFIVSESKVIATVRSD